MNFVHRFPSTWPNILNLAVMASLAPGTSRTGKERKGNKLELGCASNRQVEPKKWRVGKAQEAQTNRQEREERSTNREAGMGGKEA